MSVTIKPWVLCVALSCARAVQYNPRRHNSLQATCTLKKLRLSVSSQEDTQREEADLLRTQAVEALLNLMNTAMDLVSHTWRSHSFTQHSVAWG